MNSTFTGNTAPNGFGGAVVNSAFNGGVAGCDLRNCTISGNGAPGGSGGAIYNDGSSGGSGALFLTNCTLHNNAAAAGRGIYNSNFEGTAFTQLRNSLFKKGASGAKFRELRRHHQIGGGESE